MKKIASFFVVILCLLVSLNTSFFKTPVKAEDDCDSSCQLEQSQNKVQELENEIAAAKGDYNKYIELVSQYSTMIDELEADIAELTPQIEELTNKITELESSIEAKEKLVDELNQRVLTRMAEAQSTMHFNQYLDFILGSDNFADLLRRVYGIEAINTKEESDRQELEDTINELNSEKDELDTAKSELETKKSELETKQAEADAMKENYDALATETKAVIDDYLNQIEEQKKIQANIKLSMDDLLALDPNTGFSSPVPGSTISAGFPYYPASFGGGVHLGIDYAAGLGSYIYAPADGVIIISDDNCETKGYLGNSCGGAGGGVSYGGNQLYMLCSVNGKVYALTFSHLYSGSVHATGVVTQGTIIGRVGSSGNSTGAHCHIEMFYLGEGENEDLADYVAKLNSGAYSKSFNCGWGSAALVNNCSNKGSAPCRLNGANYLPG